MDTPLPRLLVATEFAPNAGGGGPAVVRQMLKDWPVEKLFWWSCLPERDQLFGQRVASHRVARIPTKLYPHLRWRAPKVWALEKIWAPWATGHFQRTLAELRPEAVWVIPHSWSIAPLARVMPSAKIGFHVTVQDFADCGFWVSRFGQRSTRRLAVLQRELYSAATTRDATSHPMIVELQARSDAKAAQMLHAGLEQLDVDYLSREPEPPTASLRIAYAGSILVEPTFELFITALKKIRERLPFPAILHFFGDHSYHGRTWFDPTWMHEHGKLSAPELLRALKGCDWGFSPMDLTDQDPRYNRFSFPTKFIIYLAAGLPVITLGHRESSVVKMASKYDVGLCSTVSDVGTLSGQLLAALSQPGSKLKYRTGILRCASTEFNAEKMRTVLYDCLRKCASLNR